MGTLIGCCPRTQLSERRPPSADVTHAPSTISVASSPVSPLAMSLKKESGAKQVAFPAHAHFCFAVLDAHLMKKPAPEPTFPHALDPLYASFCIYR